MEIVAPFSGKNLWAIILGGSSGMGKESARALARQGLNIALVHRDRRADLPAIEKEEASLKQLSVSVERFNKNALLSTTIDEVMACIQEHQGKVYVLLHSIAKGNLKPLYIEEGARLSEQDMTLTIQAMATSLLSWVQSIHQYQLIGEKMRVIGLSSEGNQKVWNAYGAISAAKVVLESLIRYIAVEMAPLGLRANIIQAGVTDTPSLRMIPGSDQLLEYSLKRNPLGRITTTEDIAKVISLLCLPAADWINGAIIPVDGGEHLV